MKPAIATWPQPQYSTPNHPTDPQISANPPHFPLAVALGLLITGINIYRLVRLQPSTDPPAA